MFAIILIFKNLQNNLIFGQIFGIIVGKGFL